MIVFGGYEMCEPDFEIRRNTYPYYVLELGLKGLCRLTINAREHHLQNGIIGGFSPRSPHYYKCDFSVPFEHWFIAFTGTDARKLFTASNLAAQGATIADEKIIRIFEQIIKHGLHKSIYSQQICSSYLRILLLLLASQSSVTDKVQSVVSQTWQKCRQFIDENFSTIKLPSEAANACGVNVRYMSRLFKRFGSITPNEYILRLKLNKAANMLLTSTHSIGQIAMEVGYFDPYHFSRNFKQFYGQSPRRYRNTHLVQNK